MKRAVALGLVALVAVVALAWVLKPRPSHLDNAVHQLGDVDRFTTSAKAGQTVADISTTLRADGTKCRERKEASAKCAALLSGAAFSAVTAVTLLDCTAPDIYDTRVALGRYMRALRTYLDKGAKGAPPALPKVISC